MPLIPKSIHHPLFRVSFLCVVGLLLLIIYTRAGVSPLRPTSVQCKGCNVLVIALDTLSPDHLPCYGYHRDTAPNLCAYASANTVFTHAYSNASWTLPADVSIFTSWYPSYHGITTFENYNLKLAKTIPLLPEILQKNGYTTYFGVPANDRAFPVNDVYYKGITKVIPVGSGPDEDLSPALQAFAANIAQGKKTFMFLHSYFVHGPYITTDPKRMFTTDYLPNIPLTWDEIYDNFSKDFYEYLLDELSRAVGQPNSTVDAALYEQLKNAPTLEAAHQLAQRHADELDTYYTEYYYFAKIKRMDPRNVEYVKALYDQKIFELDTWIGNTLIPYLNDPAIKDNTIVIITAEHGEEFMEHGRLSHETLYDSNVHIPFIVSVPGLKPSVSDDTIQGADVTPTVLDILGVSTRRYRFQGVNIFDADRSGSGLRGFVTASNPSDNGVVTTLRNGQWKLFMKTVGGATIPYELYDMTRDAKESSNVLASHFDLAKRMIHQYDLYTRVWKRVLR